MPIFASGTVTPFKQTSAPTGWTKLTSIDNAGIRIVSGTAGSGGTGNFTDILNYRTWTGSVGTSGEVGAYSLTTSNLPDHNHPYTYTATNVASAYATAPYASYSQATTAPIVTSASGAAGGGQAHSHPVSLSLSFSGGSHNFSVKYLDVILASKD